MSETKISVERNLQQLQQIPQIPLSQSSQKDFSRDWSLEVKTREEERNSFKVFLSTFAKKPQDEQPRIGDVAYTQALESTYNRIFGSGSAVYIRNMRDEKAIFTWIEQQSVSRTPILHIMLNVPHRGTGFTLAALEIFKKSGGKIVITTIEFENHHTTTSKKETLAYLNLADKIIFLDDRDKNGAEKLAISAGINFYRNIYFKMVLTQATVIPVPATVSLNLQEKRGRDILCFGMIRHGKGFAHIFKLAAFIRDTQHPKMKNKKIRVVGTAQDHDDPAELYRLMSTVYPSKNHEMLGKSVPELKILLKKYQQAQEGSPELQEGSPEVQEGPAAQICQEALPIRIYLDVPDEKLGSIFEQCTYSFLPAVRGATLRNSSISSSIQHGFVTISHATEITPDVLLPHGEYHGAVHLIKNNKYGSELIKGSYVFDGYAREVFEEILKREENPHLNQETVQKSSKLCTEVLNIEKIARSHADSYNEVVAFNEADKECRAIWASLNRSGFKSSESEQLPEFVLSLNTQEKANELIRSRLRTRIGNKIYQEMSGFDIPKKSSRNYFNLLKRLFHLEGPYAESLKTNLSERSPHEVFLPLEWEFIQLGLEEWTATHVTENNEPIDKVGELRSLEKLERYGAGLKKNNTHSAQGYQGVICVSLGPGKDISQPRFFDKNKFMYQFDYKYLVENNPKVFHKAWSSDHRNSYRVERICEPIVMFDCLYFISHHIIQNENGVEQHIKRRHFIYDNQHVIQTVNLGDEIFQEPRDRQAVMMMTIEILRLMGTKTWSKVMDLIRKTSDKTQKMKIVQHITQAIFNPGAYEGHVWYSLRTTTPKVSFTIRNHVITTENSNLVSVKMLHTLFHLALCGQKEDFIQHYKKYQTNEYFKQDALIVWGDHTVNLLAAVILGGEPELLQFLLDNSIDLGIENSIALSESKIFKANPLILAVILSSEPNLKDILGRMINKYAPHKSAFENATQMIDLLMNRGTIYKGTDCIRTLSLPVAANIHDSIRLFNAHPKIVLQLLTKPLLIKGKELEMVLAVNTGSIELTARMLELGASLQKRYCHSNFYPKELNLMNGFTPFLLATCLNNKEMLEFLMPYVSLADETFLTTSNELGPLSVEKYEGMDPLQIAIECKYTDLVKFFLSQKPNLNHRDAKGRNALALAKEKALQDSKGFQEIINLISESISEFIKDHDLKTQSELGSLSLTHRQSLVHYIFTGTHPDKGRYFIILGSDGYDEDLEFPFVWQNLGTEDSPERRISDFSNEWGFHLSPSQTEITSFVLSGMIQSNCQSNGQSKDQSKGQNSSIVYTDKFIICDFKDQNCNIIHRKIPKYDKEIRLVFARDIIKLYEDNTKIQRAYSFELSEKSFGAYVGKLFYKFSQCKVFSDLNAGDCFDDLKMSYKKWRQCQHEFVEKSFAGDTKALEELMRTGLVDIDHEIIVKDKYYSSLTAASENKQVECMAFLLTAAKKTNFHIPESMVNAIVKKGYLAAYKKLNQNKIKERKFDHLVIVLKEGHKEFADYIISDTSCEQMIGLLNTALSEYSDICFQFLLMNLSDKSIINDMINESLNKYISSDYEEYLTYLKRFIPFQNMIMAMLQIVDFSMIDSNLITQVKERTKFFVAADLYGLLCSLEKTRNEHAKIHVVDRKEPSLYLPSFRKISEQHLESHAQSTDYFTEESLRFQPKQISTSRASSSQWISSVDDQFADASSLLSFDLEGSIFSAKP